MKLRKILLLNLLFLLFLSVGCKDRKTNQVCFKKHCFEVEIAREATEQKQGLMFKEELKTDHGMLFIFPETKKHSFWMKNTLIPLDIIWLNENREVVFINKNTPPCASDPCESFKPNQKARYVLELNAGIADLINLSIGDKLEFNLK